MLYQYDTPKICCTMNQKYKYNKKWGIIPKFFFLFDVVSYGYDEKLIQMTFTIGCLLKS